MSQILKDSHRDFKTTMVNILKYLVEKLCMKRWGFFFCLQMQTIIKCQGGSLEVKNAVSEMNSFNERIS